MTGVLQALLGSQQQRTITVGTDTFTSKVTTYYDGFATTTSPPAVLGRTFGALAPMAFSTSAISGLYWSGSSDHSSNGTCYISVVGTVANGFISSVLLDGVSLGAVGGGSSASGYTVFQLGSTGVANPFGTSGTKKVTIT